MNLKRVMMQSKNNRFVLCRFQSKKYINGDGWKISFGLHKKVFYWNKQWREFRLTIFGLNIHFRHN